MATQSKAARHAQMKERLESFFTAIAAHDLDAVVDNLTATVEWVAPDLPKAVYGRDEVAGYLEAQFETFPDLHYPQDDLRFYFSDDGRTAASQWTMIGTMSGPMSLGFEATGRSARVAGACFYEFHDGLISRHVMVFDTLGLAHQLGLVPSEEGLAFKALVELQRLGMRARKAMQH